jgi:hypothetical protein
MHWLVYVVYELVYDLRRVVVAADGAIASLGLGSGI